MLRPAWSGKVGVWLPPGGQAVDAGQLLRSEDLAPPGGQVLYLPAESYSRPRLRALAPRRPPAPPVSSSAAPMLKGRAAQR